MPDSADLCSIEFSLDTSGCQSDEYDQDGDGLPNDLDWCPYLSFGDNTLGVSGCPGPPTADDSDGDGVPNAQDECPAIPGSARAYGCVDNDGDGVPDIWDNCSDVSSLTLGCSETDINNTNEVADKASVAPV